MTARGSLERPLPAKVRRMNPKANEWQQFFSPLRHIVDKVFAQRTNENVSQGFPKSLVVVANRPQWCGSLAFVCLIRSLASRSCALLVHVLFLSFFVTDFVSYHWLFFFF